MTGPFIYRSPNNAARQKIPTHPEGSPQQFFHQHVFSVINHFSRLDFGWLDWRFLWKNKCFTFFTYQLLVKWHSCWWRFRPYFGPRTNKHPRLAPFCCSSFAGKRAILLAARRDATCCRWAMSSPTRHLCTIRWWGLVCLRLCNLGSPARFLPLWCPRDVRLFLASEASLQQNWFFRKRLDFSGWFMFSLGVSCVFCLKNLSV